MVRMQERVDKRPSADKEASARQIQTLRRALSRGKSHLKSLQMAAEKREKTTQEKRWEIFQLFSGQWNFALYTVSQKIGLGEIENIEIDLKLYQNFALQTWNWKFMKNI